MQQQRDQQKLYSLAPPLRQVEGRAMLAKSKQPATTVNKNWKLDMRQARSERKRKAKLDKLDARKHNSQAVVLGLEKQLVSLETSLRQPKPQPMQKNVTWLRPSLPASPA